MTLVTNALQSTGMKNFPQKFVERIEHLLPVEEVESFLQCATEPLPKTVRLVQNGKPSHQNLEDDLWDLSPVADLPNAFFIDRTHREKNPLGNTLTHFSGGIYIQSLSSMLPVIVLDPQSGEKILDLCSAPGSKTTFIAEKMNFSGVVVANEPSSSRSKKLASNVDRIGCTNVVLTQSDGVALSAFLGQEFDRILLDAPCSSEGYGRKSADFFTRNWNEKNIFASAKLQKRLIESAFKMLKPGGTLVYSTCTTAPEENELVVQYLCDTFGDAVEICAINFSNIPHYRGVSAWDSKHISAEISSNVCRLYPHLKSVQWDSECFFVAKIKKIKPLELMPPQKSNPPKIKKLDKQKTAEILVHIQKKWGIDRKFFKTFVFWVRENGSVWMGTKEVFRYIETHLCRRAGMEIFNEYGKITSIFSMNFGHLAIKNCVDLDLLEYKKWMQGNNLQNKNTKIKMENFGGVFLVRYRGVCLGFGTMQEGGILKNKLSRELVLGL